MYLYVTVLQGLLIVVNSLETVRIPHTFYATTSPVHQQKHCTHRLKMSTSHLHQTTLLHFLGFRLIGLQSKVSKKKTSEHVL